MANTLHRTLSRGAVPSVEDLLSPYLGLSLEEAREQKKHGRLGIAICAMIERKHELASKDTEYAKTEKALESLLDRVNKAVDAKAKDMLKAMGDEPSGDDIAFTKGFIRNRNHKQDYEEADKLRSQMQAIADTQDEKALAAGVTSLMGTATGKRTFPKPSSVYTIYNNFPRWHEMAFVSDNNRNIEGVFVANGDGWDRIDSLTGVRVTSTKTMQQIHYTYNSGGDKEIKRLLSLVTVNGFTAENFDPFRGITCGQSPQVKDVVKATEWKAVNLPG